MQFARFLKILGGGLVATLVMTIILYGAQWVAVPQLDIAGMLASPMVEEQSAPLFSNAWFLGMAIHLVLGIVVFPIVYGYVIVPFIAGKNWVRGLLFGIALLIVAALAILPIFGRGVLFTNTPAPITLSVLAAVAHIAYGLILGVMAAPQAEYAEAPPPQEAHAHAH